MRPAPRPRLYFSFRSPYSWLMIRRLRAAVPDVFEAVDLIPYWQPDQRTRQELERRGGAFHYVEMSKAKHLYLLADVKRLAEREGAPIVWPVDRRVWWEAPHLAWLLARRLDRGEAFYDALIAARWGAGQDICTPAVIGEAAVRAGIDPEPAVQAPEDPSLREEGVGCLYQAHLDSVFGVPYVRWGRHRFWGFDRVEAFVELWRPAADPDAAGDEEGGIPAELVDARSSSGFGLGEDCPGGCG